MSDTHDSQDTIDAKELRARANAAYAAMDSVVIDRKEAEFPEATKLLLHELRVHQIELEMQNEELRRSHRELEESRARYFDLYDLAPVGYISVDAAGLIQKSNFTVATLLGVTREELAQRAFVSFIQSEDADIFYLLCKELLKTGQAQSSELRLKKQDGAIRWVHLEATVARGEDAPIIRVVLNDVTARKQAERELLLLERKIQEKQKLESLGVLAGGVAHDFNNLLTIILSSSSLAERDVASQSPVHAHLRSINEASHRAADLCRQMLDYSGRGRFQLQIFDFSQMVEATADLLKLLFNKEIKIKFYLNNTLPQIEGDVTQLRQVIMNLVINASESLGDSGGEISLKTGLARMKRAELGSTVETPDLPEGDYVFLEVSDTGCGMSPETQAKLYDPFFTTKFSGRGLGMAAVSGIVRAHQGGIKVESKVGKGTTFRLFFPTANGSSVSRDGRLASPAKVLTNQPSSSAEIWQGSGTVLVVDDEAVIREVIGEFLELSGLDSVSAVDGQAALEIFRADPDRFTLVLLDLTMPNMGGEETFLELQKLRPDVRVVLMSGYTQENAMVQFPGKGPISFLSKPFTVVAFRAMLEEVLGGEEGKA